MHWSRAAEEAIAKVPFFVKKKVRKKIELEVEAMGASEVTLDHVQIVKQNFLNKMEDDIKGYQVETCFGPSGCPNRIPKAKDFAERVQEILKKRDLKSFLKSKVQGPLKYHHEFRVSLSDCPNACSRPQISDVGIIAAIAPAVRGSECNQCGLCSEACIENAVAVTGEMNAPEIDLSRCVYCGQCVKACPNETLVALQEGFRMMIGGKLGRHPRLASELTGFFSRAEVLELIDGILDVYAAHNQRGERLGEMIERIGIDKIEQMVMGQIR